ncbi:MAG TPA: hypothetical protein VI299_15440 [Polyangiales bacterium]
MMALRTLSVALLVSACHPEIHEGMFACTVDDDCPRGWVCEARGADREARCFERRTGDTMDASIPGRTGGSMIFLNDAGAAYGCGAWKRVHATDAPPANAEPYGVEYTEQGGRPEFLCRFETDLEGKKLVVQGRAVFGLACLATLPATENTLARARPSADFEVLVDSAQCARWVTYYPGATRGMQTGTDLDGKPTYSCRGIVKSSGLPDKSKYLGRFIPGRNGGTDHCVYELQSSVRVAPSADPGAEESVEVLAIP